MKQAEMVSVIQAGPRASDHPERAGRGQGRFAPLRGRLRRAWTAPGATAPDPGGCAGGR
jgi:hypothetical protein